MSGGCFCLVNDNVFSVVYRLFLCVNEVGNLGNMREIDIVVGNNVDGFVFLNIMVEFVV